jgi:hypothetical protein
VKELVLKNRDITICVAANMLRILFGSVENENDLKIGIQGMSVNTSAQSALSVCEFLTKKKILFHVTSFISKIW